MQEVGNDERHQLKLLVKRHVLVRSGDTNIYAPDGARSEWLFDFRNVILEPGFLELYTRLFWDKYNKRFPFQIGGMETAAIPLVTALVIEGNRRGYPVSGFFIRKSRKKIGLQKFIEGTLNAHKIILIDDLINTGGSFLKQLEVLKAEERDVADLFAIVRFRERNAYAFLNDYSAKLSTLFTLPDFGIPYEHKHNVIEKKYFDLKWYFRSENPNLFHVVPKSAPVIDGRKVYFGSDNRIFWALNQEDGNVEWKFKVGLPSRGKSIFSTPTIDKKNVYFGAYDGNVYALDKETGKKRWEFAEADWIGSSPCIASDLDALYVGLEFGLIRKRGGIVCLNKRTGKKKWDYILPEFTHSSPAYNKGHRVVAIGSNDQTAYLFDAKRGKLLWSFKTEGDVKYSFVFDEVRKLVLFGSLDGNLYALDIKTGKKVFSYKAEFGIYSNPVLYKNTVIFASLDKRIYCVNLDTYTLAWSHATGGRIFASPVIVQGRVYVGSNDGKLYELDPETGKHTGFFQTTERIVNEIAYNPSTKKFFVPTVANEVYCINRLDDE